MSARTAGGDIVIEYLKRYPKHSKSSLAKLLAAEHPLFFKSVEHARGAIRHHTGAKGRFSKFNQAEKVKRDTGFTSKNPYAIPDSYTMERKPYHLPVADNNILIIGDLHIPYHDIPAIECAVKYGKEQNINTIFINGDLLDMHQMSRFEKDPRKRNTKQEVEAGIEFLSYLRQEFPKARIYYHYGNHDIRYERFLMANPQIFDDPYYELENRMGLGKLKIQTIDDKTVTHAGKLMIHHGHYIFRGSQSPVSPAKTILDKSLKSMICGHVHKVSEHTKTDANGDIMTSWSMGCLSELTPDYSPMCNNYAHGFAHAIIRADKSFTIRNFRIKNGRIL